MWEGGQWDVESVNQTSWRWWKGEGQVLCIVWILFTAGSVLAAAIHASLLYHMHMDTVKELHFYGDQLFMETSWKRESTRPSEAHYGWNRIVVCLNSPWIWCACWLYLSEKINVSLSKHFSWQSKIVIWISQRLVTSGLVESECTDFSERWFFFTGFYGFDLQDY